MFFFICLCLIFLLLVNFVIDIVLLGFLFFIDIGFWIFWLDFLLVENIISRVCLLWSCLVFENFICFGGISFLFVMDFMCNLRIVELVFVFCIFLIDFLIENMFYWFEELFKVLNLNELRSFRLEFDWNGVSVGIFMLCLL